MGRYSIALATSVSPLPPSDLVLIAALRRLGANAIPVLWHSSVIDWGGFDCVVVRSCWDYHLRLPEFLAWLDGLAVMTINYPRLIKWNADKRYLRELSSAGVAIPDTIWNDVGEQWDVRRVCEERGWLAAVVKPLVSASAYGTERLTSGIVSGTNMIQEYLGSIETEGEWSLLYFGGRYSHAVRKRPGAGDFRVQMEFGGTVEAAEPDPAMRAFAEEALSLLPHAPVIARVDVLQSERGCLLMEMEVIEPELFLTHAPGSADRAAAAIMSGLIEPSPRASPDPLL